MLKGIVAIVASAFSMSATGAQAADMPVKAPAVSAAPAFSWTGLYIGVSGGFAWGRTGATVPPPPPPPPPAPQPTGSADTEPETDGGAIGGVIAYYKQLANTNFVFGVAADGHWANIKGETSGSPFYRAETDAFGTVRGQAGLAFGRILVSATGGFAWVNNQVTVGTATHFVTDSQTHTGYVVGGILDAAVTDRAVLSVQFLHFDFGEQDYFLYGSKPIRARFDAIMGQFKYRLGGPG